MRFFIKYFFLLFTILLLTECKPPVYFKTADTSLKLDSTIADNKQVRDLIAPYKTKLDAEMNEVLVISSEEFPAERGKPETKLGNLVADLSLEVANQLYKPTDNDSIDFCLLNFGGLRTSLPKGPITRGKIFELMPFENELVVVTINKKRFINFNWYLYESGGQPVSNIKTKKIHMEEMSKITYGPFIFKNDKYSSNNEFKILTSDYLANGGDNMIFFLNPIKTEPVGIKLRDAIIQYCIEQNKQGNQLVGKLDGRITFE